MTQEASNTPNLAMESWESEGGGLTPAVDPASLGIVRQMTETYLVDGYRYTTLGDAVAQARRMAKLQRDTS